MTIDKKRTEKKSLLLETIADKKTYFTIHTHGFAAIIHLHPPLWQKRKNLKGGRYECSISLSHYKDTFHTYVRTSTALQTCMIPNTYIPNSNQKCEN